MGQVRETRMAIAAAKSLQSYPTVEPHGQQPTRLLCPLDSPGKNTGGGCHFLLQRWQLDHVIKKGAFCVTVSLSVVPGSSQPHGLQHANLPGPSLTPGACSNSCPLSRWCHPTILPSVIPFSSCLQSFPAPGFFPESQFFASSSQRIGDLASILPMNIQDWLPLGLTG